ncbi:MAG: 30S ribosomal protein S21 [Chloroflexota bacterium]
MSEVVVDRNESIESALRRFNKKVQQDGVLAEYRRRSYYEKPTTKRKRKRATKLRKSIKNSTK